MVGIHSMRGFFPPLFFFFNGRRVCYKEKTALFELQISAATICFPLIFSRETWNLEYLSICSWNTLPLVISTLKHSQQYLYSPCLIVVATICEESIRKLWLDFITECSFVTIYQLSPYHLFKYRANLTICHYNFTTEVGISEVEQNPT